MNDANMGCYWMPVEDKPKNMTQARNWSLEDNRPRVQQPERMTGDTAQLNAGLTLRQPL